MVAFLKANVYSLLYRFPRHRVGDVLRRSTNGAILILIALYRAVGSLWLSGSCRFEPSCSIYAQEAIERYGFLVGGRLTAIRLWRCRPGGPFGLDLVPMPSEKMAERKPVTTSGCC